MKRGEEERRDLAKKVTLCLFVTEVSLINYKEVGGSNLI